MAAVAKGIHHLGVGSLSRIACACLTSALAFAQTPASVPLPEATPLKRMEPATIGIRDVLYSLAEQQEREWSEVAAKEWADIEARVERDAAQKKIDLRAQRNQFLESARKTLADLAAQRLPADVQADIELQLALVLAVDPERTEEALRHAEASARAAGTLPSARRTAVLAALLATDLAAKLQVPERGALVARKVDAGVGGSLPRGGALRTRLSVAVGDGEFAAGRFGEASAYYQDALENLQLAPQGEFDVQRPALPGLQVRLLWATYRDGNYAATLHWAVEVARRRDDLAPVLTPPMLREMVRMGGIALYERDEDRRFEQLARDGQAHDVGKDMILGAIEAYRGSGRLDRAFALSERMHPHFTGSRRLLDLAELTRTLLAQRGDQDFLVEKTAAYAVELEREGVWRSRFDLGAGEEERRAAFVSEWSLRGARQFMQLAGRSESILPARKALHLFEIRLREFPREDERAALLVEGAQAALQAQEAERAVALARVARNAKLPQASLEKIHFIEVAALEQLSRAPGAGAADHERHRDAVHAFARSFPADLSAFQAMFELGRKQMLRKDWAGARESLERALTQASLDSFAALADERQRVVRALLEVNARLNSAEEGAEALSSLRERLADAPLDSETKRLLDDAGALEIREQARALRLKGQPDAAAETMLSWCQRNRRHPHLIPVLTDAVRGLAEVAAWKRVDEAVADFASETRAAKDARELSFWRARSFDERLRFSEAARAYADAAIPARSDLAPEMRLAAVERALLISEESGSSQGLAQLYGLQAQLSRTPHSRARARLGSARLEAESGSTGAAKKTLAKALGDAPKGSALRAEIELKLLDLRLLDPQDHGKARIELERAIGRLAALPAKTDPFAGRDRLKALGAALTIAEREDAEEWEQLLPLVRARPSASALGRMGELVAVQERRARVVPEAARAEEEIAAYLRRTLRARGFRIAAERRAGREAALRKLAGLANGVSEAQRDAWLVRAADDQAKAREWTRRALSLAAAGSEEHLRAARLATGFDPRARVLPPQSAPMEPGSIGQAGILRALARGPQEGE